MASITSFKDLTVWQVSMDLADVCFDIIEAIPHPYRFIFADRLIPAGISSLGSHGEVETLFELIRRRKLVPEPLLGKGAVLIDPIGKMLHGLTESLEACVNAQNA
jgi:hypothetical protein